MLQRFFPSLVPTQSTEILQIEGQQYSPFESVHCQRFPTSQSLKTGKTGKHITVKSHTFNPTQIVFVNVYIYPFPPINKIKTLQGVQNNMQGRLGTKGPKPQINHPLSHK